jgi:hypothetical protein
MRCSRGLVNSMTESAGERGNLAVGTARATRSGSRAPPATQTCPLCGLVQGATGVSPSYGHRG